VDTSGFSGQWVGKFVGSSSGSIVVNVDDRGERYDVEAYLSPLDGPSLVAFLSIPNKEHKFHVRTDFIEWHDASTGLFVNQETIAAKFPAGSLFSKYADVDGTFEKDNLTLAWTTDIGTNGNCALPRSKAAEPSELETKNMEWDSYKDYVSGITSKRYLFRGQDGPFRLRTSFHRTGRAHLRRFIIEDIAALHRHLSARTKHYFNLQIPDENGAFLNLVQHHGYPTPLLDWTYSPYVAAFFAYRKISSKKAAKAEPNQKVRILVLDQAQWKQDWRQILMLNLPTLHLSIGEFVSVENERMIPQQAATTVTNSDDIESYVRSKEAETKKKYLWALDLPVTDRNSVVHELRYMGITAGSMFPGLDGACEELKQRNFEI
jgi:hypothetical protein